jgi:hypothetical protein
VTVPVHVDGEDRVVGEQRSQTRCRLGVISADAIDRSAMEELAAGCRDS